jgi:5-amino-6-(5-phosphoribosylamino)uracil reductase
MRQLLPTPGEADLDDLIRRLEPAAEWPSDRPYVVSNFAVTWDGSVTIGGRAGPIGSAVDRRLLQRLRARADAVLVGAGTVRVERYGPLLADRDLSAERQDAGRSADPLAVVASRRCDLPWDAGLFSSGRGEVLVLTGADCDPPSTETPVSVRRFEGQVDLAAALRELRGRGGVELVVCEGGPILHAELLDLGLIDELFVTVAPKLAGGTGPGILEGLAERERRLRLVWLLEQENELFARLAVA